MATNSSSVDGQGAHCGIYGSNCPEWVMAMQVTSFHFISFLSEFFFTASDLNFIFFLLQACNSQGICYVPLYDTLGRFSTSSQCLEHINNAWMHRILISTHIVFVGDLFLNAKN
jgi:hypothetical protein